MSTDQFESPAMTGGSNLIPRDRFGRPMIQPPGGGKAVAYTRATTVADTLDDRYNLELWKMRQVAAGLAARKDLVALAAAKQGAYLRAVQGGDEHAEKMAKRDLNQICKDATDAAASGAAANYGTALHEFIESVNKGVDPSMVPDDLRPDVEAYINAMEPFEVVAAEQFLVLDDLKIGGTTDFIVRHRSSGDLMIADLKTGRGATTFGQQSIAVQLALYSRGSIYHPDTHDREPILVDQEAALVVHLPVGTGQCTIHRVDITAGWEAVQHSMWTREWRKHRNLFEPVTFAKMDHPESTTPAAAAVKPVDWAAHVSWAETVTELNAVYLRARDAGVADDEIVPLCKARKATIQQLA